MNKNIEALLYSYLLKGRHKTNKFSEEEQSQIIEICANYLTAGFVLESCKLDPNNIHLLHSLKEQRKVASMRLMSMKQDLISIAKIFNSKNIDFITLKGMALIMGGIYKTGIRASRDIDLLIPKEQIPHAYQTLRSIGFKYMNPEVADQANIMFKHDLPVMINDRGTLIELHWRLTKHNIFQECPLTNAFINHKKQSDAHDGIYIPNIACMMAHALHHGVDHHDMEHGPIFLFDLAAIYKSNQNQWPEDNSLIIKLDLLEKFEQSKRLVKLAGKEECFSEESQKLIDTLFKNFNWFVGDKNYSLLGVSSKRILVKDWMPKLQNRIKMVSHMYQLPPSSWRYWLIFFKDMIRVIKKFRL